MTRLTAIDECRAEIVRGSDFFGKHGLAIVALADAVLASGPIATGPGGRLWHYHDGVWRTGGENEVTRRVISLLGDRWRSNQSNDLIRFFQSRDPLITDEPDRRWVNCENGLLDWSTGDLHDHDPGVASTWQLSTKWNPDAVCPTVDDWIAEVAPDDAVTLLWQVLGAAIYADLAVQRAVLLFGPGRNGKGTFLRLIKALVGGEHCAAVTLQALSESRWAKAQLFGRAVNLAGDLDARSIKRTDDFKMATGGDTMTAERKGQNMFEFTNRALMVFAANELPGTFDHTDGFHSRWVVVPFDKLRLRPDEEDPSIEARMERELEGVFVKAVAGLRGLMSSGGFDIPASVAAATSDYRDQTDPVRRFIEERISITGVHEQRELRSAVFNEYRSWCGDENHRPLAASKFWGRIRTIDDRINVDAHSNGQRQVSGIRFCTVR